MVPARAIQEMIWDMSATGFAADVRKDDPYAAYPDLDFNVITTEGGDALSRAVQIRKEYEMTIGLVRQILNALPAGKIKLFLGNPMKFTVPVGDTYARVESSKGEYGYYVVSDGGLRPYRVSVRGPSTPAGLALCHEHLPGMRIVAAGLQAFDLTFQGRQPLLQVR